MDTETIEGFDALQFKEDAQSRVQTDLAGLAPAERLRRMRERVSTGPFAEHARRWSDATARRYREAEEERRAA